MKARNHPANERTVRCPGAACAVLVLAACGGRPAFDTPVTVDNCGGEARFERAPRRVVALNQTATEVLLTLGLGDAIVATAWQDNDPAPEFAPAYERIPVRWSGYPSPEQFADVKPDFAYATLTSAFDDDVRHARETLRPFDVEVYVSPWACGATSPPGAALSFEPIAREIREVAAIFGVAERGAALASEVGERLDAVRSAGARRPGPPPVVVWWVSGGEEPLFASGRGVLQLATEAARALNLYADSPGSYTPRTWEEFAVAEANWIGLVDQANATAAQKRAFLAAHPLTAGLRAVREERYVVVPFSHTLPGVGVADVAEKLAEAIESDMPRSESRGESPK